MLWLKKENLDEGDTLLEDVVDVGLEKLDERLGCKQVEDGGINCNNEEDGGPNCGSEKSALDISFEDFNDNVGIYEDLSMV